jgi:hypothetical protein
MRCFKITAVVAAGVFICFGSAMAEGVVLLPDLTVESVTFQPLPKEGGVIDSVMIGIKNQGKGDAIKCALSLSCSSIRCDEGSECEKISRLINKNIPVPALKSGEGISLKWKPDVPISWIGGKYSVAAVIDKFNAVQESDEANNAGQNTVYVKSFSPRQGV